MEIQFTDEARTAMEEKGILEADVAEVVEYAESVQKLYDDEGNNLGKRRLDSVTVYAEYTVNGGVAEVKNVYSHRVTLGEDQ